MRCIYLIIASSNLINLQDELAQRKTWAIDNKEVIWLRGGNENYFDSVSQTLFVDVEERYENILEKTIKGVKWCLENIEFDFLVRGNVSTYFVPKRIMEVCEKYNSNHEFLGGYIDFMKDSKSRRNVQMFVSGAAIFLNRKAAQSLTSIDINLWNSVPDDVAISQFLFGRGVNPTWIPRCNLSTTSILTKRAYYRMKSSENGNIASIRMQNLDRIRKAKNKKCLLNLILRFYFDEIKWAKRNYKSFSGYLRSLFSIASVKFRVLWLTRSGQSYVST